MYAIATQNSTVHSIHLGGWEGHGSCKGIHIADRALLTRACDALMLLMVIVSEELHEAFHNRHGRVAQNVLCVCDLEMKFTFPYTGWDGTTHDARIFIDALSQASNQFP